jgi:hypothetical protein
MKTTLRFTLLMLLMIALAACQSTGDDEEDAAAAQSFFPEFTEYTVQGTENIQDAIASTLTAANLSTANVPLAGVVLKMDDFIDCYRETGSFDAQIYVENPTDQLIEEGVRLPYAGLLVIVNQDRLANNLLPCLTRGPQDLFGAQAVQTPDPCSGNGTFEFEGDTIGYLYLGSDGPMCDLFQIHLDQYGS